MAFTGGKQMRRWIIVAIVACTALPETPSARAGVYQPESLLACDVDEHGFAEPLPLDIFLTLVNILKKTDNPENDEAKALKKRIAELKRTTAVGPKPEDLIELAADYLRFRHDPASIANALNLLQPLSRTAPDDIKFLILSLQAQAHFLNSTFREAQTN